MNEAGPVGRLRCVWCGRRFDPTQPGKPQRFCSADCRKASLCQRAKEKVIRERKAYFAAQNPTLPEYLQSECPVCGRERKRKMKTCSRKCSRTFHDWWLR